LICFALLSKTSFAEVADFIDLVLYMEVDSHNNRIIRHIKEVERFDEKTSEFILQDLDTAS